MEQFDKDLKELLKLQIMLPHVKNDVSKLQYILDEIEFILKKYVDVIL